MTRLFPNTGTFRSLANYNYRLWAGGAIVSNVGTWMQRVAQDWLVLTQLTDNSASTVGVVMALQFGPQMLMLPWSGFAADFFDRRKLLMVTQAAMGLCALGLGLLTVTGLVELWHVWAFREFARATYRESPAGATWGRRSSGCAETRQPGLVSFPAPNALTAWRMLRRGPRAPLLPSPFGALA